MALLHFFLLPLKDFWRGYERVLGGGPKALLGVALGLIVGWWVYIPVHELMHAFGCMLAGGEVTRLEIDELYGGTLLAKWIPWVYAGSDYAGQLTGFDTHGSDLIYFATDFGPFVFTLFPAVWLLRRFGRTGFALGFALVLPFAFAPFLSITGDAYEIGSIVVTQFEPWSADGVRELLRGDDLFLKAEELGETPSAPWDGYRIACAIGVLWAFATYALGAAIAGLLSPKAHDPAAANAAGS